MWETGRTGEDLLASSIGLWCFELGALNAVCWVKFFVDYHFKRDEEKFRSHPINQYCFLWWRNYLRHCPSSWKVAWSIPNGVIGIFHWHNPSCRTMTLGSFQPLTEIVPGIPPGGRGKGVGLTTLPPSCADYIEILGTSTAGPLWACNWTVEGLLYLPFYMLLSCRTITYLATLLA